MPQTAVQPLSASAENPDALYSNDPYTWALQQAKALREMRLGDVDWKHVIKAVEDVAANAQSEWIGSCRQTVLHQLLVDHHDVSDAVLRRWRREVLSYRTTMQVKIGESPGIKESYRNMFALAWERARSDACIRLSGYMDEADPSKGPHQHWRAAYKMLPEECPYWLADVAGLEHLCSEKRFSSEIWPPTVAQRFNAQLSTEYSIAWDRDLTVPVRSR